MTHPTNVNQECDGIVQVDHDQFLFAEEAADTLDVAAKGSLIEVGPGFVSTFTGVSYGPARVSVQLLRDVPGEAAEHWEVVEQTMLVASGPITTRNLDGEPVAEMSELEPRTYHLRASARGRDIATSTEVFEPTEDYLFELWPATEGEASAEPLVRTIRKNDRAWSDELVDEPVALKPDYSTICVRDVGGNILRVAPQSDLGQAAIRITKEHGGRPLDGALADQVYAMQVAYVDRPLVDWLAIQSPGLLSDFKAACVELAFTRAGLDQYSWLNELAQKAVRDRRLDYDECLDLLTRAHDDPAIRRRLVPGIPGRFESLEQFEAINTLNGFLEPAGSDALYRALETYLYALKTFGMEGYEGLVATLRQRFAIPAN
ncbi:hypothetical protein HQ325_16570 [Rhodococcus sp. BP-349]|uniref:hypothetical protein n=1 Tax=unclassified Rhodococcus (in: high G+C Gram-positive bacteria) TaxID=192944 RepID=UPI001C9A5F0E|nr:MULTISPECIES: hypothetical protein [unclassified Rhodococcus (in: high G+C Gram-positive bacteria)]MBY6540289.1 hypothetical protein [Rhodococcus sp. BP-363]MBY6545686.1 hypothetical protein [Rhodococcus sp. BP-369]MBY6564916.1 hypothetical protein [Rhodococcus sp. BP-370]MBY6578148.1 hypothetical protein [Rhodococcus sp. BP-364]MBY6587449.1 hypothetical protein [Rhodococcus sp. BP-358]